MARSRVAGILVALGGLIAGGSLWAIGAYLTPSGPAKVVVDREGMNWGRVAPGSKVSSTFSLKNGGGEALELGEPKATCGCTKPVLPRRRLAPGEAVAMTVDFQVPMNHGPVAHAITISTSDPGRPSLVLALHAHSWVGVLPSPQSIDLGDVRPGSTVERTVQLHSPDKKPFKLGRVSSDLAGVTVQADDAGLASPLHRLKIRYRPEDRLGAIRGTLQVATDQADATILDVPLFGRITGPIIITPATLAIERDQIGEITNHSLLIRPSGERRQIDLKRVDVQKPWEVVEQRTRRSDRDGSILLELSLRFPTGAGAMSGDLTLTIASPDAAFYHVPLTIHGWTPAAPPSTR